MTSISRSGGVLAILDGSLDEFKETRLTSELMNRSLWIRWIQLWGMQRFPACEGLQERGCLCLALLTAGTEDNKAGCEMSVCHIQLIRPIRLQIPGPAEVSADYSKGKHQESSVLLRSQSRRLVVRQGLGVAKVCKIFLRSRCKPKSAR